VQYYWAYFVGYYFSPDAGFAIDDEEGMSFAAGGHPNITGGTFRAMEPKTDIATYLRAHAQELGDRILQSYPPSRHRRFTVAAYKQAPIRS
jgi:hypothetical protein